MALGRGMQAAWAPPVLAKVNVQAPTPGEAVGPTLRGWGNGHGFPLEAHSQGHVHTCLPERY